MAWPSSSIVRRRFPWGVRPILVIFLRWAKGSVYDLLLCERGQPVVAMSVSQCGRKRASRILDEVENRHAISYWREEVSAIWVEEEVASAVDRSKKV